MLQETLLLCGFAFLAGMVDAVAGGGGLIQVPALFAILPSAAPAVLLGTNKLSSIAGTLTATLRYARSVNISWRGLGVVAVIALGASAVGAWAVAMVPSDVFKPIGVVLLILVAIYTVRRRTMGLTAEGRRTLPSWMERGYGGLVGFYDGFFGPGAGSFFTFGYVRWFGLSFLEATAAAKVLNLATNAGALLVFMSLGSVEYRVAAPMMLANVLGGLTGASLAIARGAGFVRSVFLVVVWTLIAKLMIDLSR